MYKRFPQDSSPSLGFFEMLDLPEEIRALYLPQYHSRGRFLRLSR